MVYILISSNFICLHLCGGVKVCAEVPEWSQEPENSWYSNDFRCVVLITFFLILSPIVFSAAFIRVVGSVFVQKYLGEEPRMVKDVFQLARENVPSIIFIDEIDAIATKRFNAQTGGMYTASVCIILCPSRYVSLQ